MTTLQDWIAVEARISDEQDWCQHDYVRRTKDGCRQVCLFTAMAEVAALDLVPFSENAADRYNAMAHALSQANPGLIARSIPEFNDKNPHSEVRDAVRRTIAWLRRQETINEFLKTWLARTEARAAPAPLQRDERTNQEFLKRCEIRQGR